MKQSLYNIAQDHRFTLLEIEEMAGELTPELEKKLEIQAHQLEQKSIAYLEVISTKENFNQLIDAEIKRLQAMKKSNSNIINRLKDNLLNAVKIFGSFNSGLHKFGTRKSSSVEVEDVNLLPNEFKTIKITETANKTAIKEALKAGKEIEGCQIKEHLNLKVN